MVNRWQKPELGEDRCKYALLQPSPVFPYNALRYSAFEYSAFEYSALKYSAFEYDAFKYDALETFESFCSSQLRFNSLVLTALSWQPCLDSLVLTALLPVSKPQILESMVSKPQNQNHDSQKHQTQ